MVKSNRIIKSSAYRGLTRIAKRKIYASKKVKRQGFTIADNGYKVRHGTSKAEEVWLNKLNVPIRSKVLILFGKTYVIDGFDPTTNTCFEYNGEAYHGSHKVYPINRDQKTWMGKSPNELYYGTIQRYELLRNCGMKVFFVWEKDFKSGKTMGRFYRGPGDNLY